MVTRVPADTAFVVERLGRYHRTLATGVHVITPFIDRIAFRYSLLPKDEELSDVCITHDNVAVRILSTLHWRIVDAQKAAYAAADVAEFIAGVIRHAIRQWVSERRYDDVRETTRELRADVVRASETAAADAGVEVIALDIHRIERAA